MALLLAATVLCFAGSGSEQVFRGTIADSQCALNVHSLSRSHQEMLKKHEIGTTAAECARYCVKHRIEGQDHWSAGSGNKRHCSTHDGADEGSRERA